MTRQASVGEAPTRCAFRDPTRHEVSYAVAQGSVRIRRATLPMNN